MLLAAALALGVLGGLTGDAGAAVYWANGNGVSRMNLDGTNPSPGLITGRSEPFGTPCGLAVDDSHLYWADRFNDRIGRSWLDGSHREDAFIVGADEPCGVVVSDGYIYWANYGGTTIGRATVDGTDVEQDFVTGLYRPCGVAVNRDFIYWAGLIDTESGYRDVVGRAIRLSGAKQPDMVKQTWEYDYCGVAADESHVYWGSYGDAIGRVGADGSDPEPRFIEGLQSPCSVAIWDGKLYFGEISQWWNGNGHISRANLDGTGLERELAGADSPCGIAVDSLVFGPSYVAVPPLPQRTPCKVDAARVSKRNGSALLRLDGPAYGSFSVTTKGLRWRVLPRKRPPSGAAVFASWRWWLQIWPRRKGRVANRLRRRLATAGRAAIEVRVGCSEEGKVANSSSRKLVLHRPVRRKHRVHSRRGSHAGYH